MVVRYKATSSLHILVIGKEGQAQQESGAPDFHGATGISVEPGQSWTSPPWNTPGTYDMAHNHRKSCPSPLASDGFRLGGSASTGTWLFLFWQPQRAEMVQGASLLRGEMVVPNQVDMFPAQWGDMSDRGFGNLLAALAQGGNRLRQIDRIPGRDGCHEQVQATGPVKLIFKRPITQFSQAPKEELTRQRVQCLSLVEADEDPPPQRFVTKVVQQERRSL